MFIRVHSLVVFSLFWILVCCKEWATAQTDKNIPEWRDFHAPTVSQRALVEEWIFDWEHQPVFDERFVVYANGTRFAGKRKRPEEFSAVVCTFILASDPAKKTERKVLISMDSDLAGEAQTGLTSGDLIASSNAQVDLLTLDDEGLAKIDGQESGKLDRNGLVAIESMLKEHGFLNPLHAVFRASYSSKKKPDRAFSEYMSTTEIDSCAEIGTKTFVTWNRRASDKMNYRLLVVFEDGLPVFVSDYIGNGKGLEFVSWYSQGTTKIKWTKEVNGFSLPTHIKNVSSIAPGKDWDVTESEFDMELKWKLGLKVPDSIFNPKTIGKIELEQFARP